MASILPDELSDNVIFLAGMARSGTTVISRALDIHPQVYTPTDETLFVEHVWQMREKAPDFLLRRTFFGSEGFSYASMRGILANLPGPESRRMADKIEDAFRSLDFRKLYALHPQAYFLHNDKGKDPAQVRYWKDKSTVREGFGLVARNFPKAKFIFIIRNPLAAVKSQLINGFGLRNHDVPIEKIRACDPTGNAIFWSEMNRRIHDFHASGRHDSLLIKYEDFVAAPHETIIRMYDHVGLDPVDRDFMDEYVFRRKARSNDPGKQSASLSGVHDDSLRSHEQVLSPAQIALISGITSSDAERFGYEVTPSRHPIATMVQSSLIPPRRKVKLLARRMLAPFR